MRLATSLNLLLLCALTLLIALHGATIPFANLASASAISDNWYALVHFGINQFVAWRDPLLVRELVSILQAWSPILLTGPHAFASANYFLFALGVALLCRPLKSVFELIWAVSAATISAIIMALLFGYDRVTSGALSWFPWLILALIHFRSCTHKTSSMLWGAACLLCFFLVSQSANQLTVLVVTAALVLSWRQPSNRTATTQLAFTVFLILASLLNSALAPLPDLPDYPKTQAHLVPDDGLPGITRSILGTDLDLPVINRQDVKHRFSELSIALLVLSLLAVVASKQLSLLDPKLVLFLAASLCLDVLAPESVSEISPLQTLARVIPGTATFSLALIGAAALSAILLMATASSRRALLFFLYSLALALVAVTSPLLKSTDNVLASSADQKSLLPLLSSPSYYLLRENGLWIGEEREQLAALRSTPLPTEGLQLFASARSDAAHLAKLLDPRPGNRWSEGNGRQNGTEWIKIVWDQPQTLRGLEIDPGKFSSDFPRGLRISSSETCQADSSILGFRKIVEQQSFQGGMHYSPSGFPYFGAQSDVRLYFPASIQTRCLLIEQIGEDSAFDWSVAAIRILTP